MHIHGTNTGLRFGAALAACALAGLLACASPEPETKRSQASAASPQKAANAKLRIALSINGEEAHSVDLVLGADGYSAALVDAISQSPEGHWASFIANAKGGASLRIPIRRYPNADVALHKNASTGLIRAGLRARGGNFVPGFIVNSPETLELFDSSYLAGQGQHVAALPVTHTSSPTPLKLKGSVLSQVGTVDRSESNRDSKKKRWSRLTEALAALGTPLLADGKLVLRYEDDDGKKGHFQVSASEALAAPDHLLIKLNKRGQWKLLHLSPGPDGALAENTVVLIGIEIL